MRRVTVSALALAVVAVPLLEGTPGFLGSVGLAGPPGTGARVAGTPLWLGLLGEAALASVALLWVGRRLSTGTVRLPRPPGLLPFVGLVLVALLAQAARSPALALAGLRFVAPVALAFVAVDVADDVGFARVALAVVSLATVASALAVVQAAVGGSGYYGATSIFAVPNTFATTVTTAVAFLPALRPSRATTLALLSLFGVAVLLSGSGAGLLGLAAVVGLWYLRVHEPSPRRVAVAAVAAVGVAATLPAITGRSRIWTSLASRVAIFAEVLVSADPLTYLVGRGLGAGTNTAVLLARSGIAPGGDGAVFVSDSLYSALLAQLGVVGLGSFVVLNAWLVAVAYRRSSPVGWVAWLLIPTLGLQAATFVTFEHVPVGWLYWFVVGALVRDAVGPATDPSVEDAAAPDGDPAMR